MLRREFLSYRGVPRFGLTEKSNARKYPDHCVLISLARQNSLSLSLSLSLSFARSLSFSRFLSLEVAI
jgi:hypothetical protein